MKESRSNRDQSPGPEWPERLAQGLTGIREPAQRFSKIIETLQTKDSAEVAEFLHTAISRAGDPTSHWQQLHLDLIRSRENLRRLGYEKLAEIYNVAAENDWDDVKSLIHLKRLRETAAEEIPEGYAARLASLTLGERRQLSRQPKRGEIGFLLFDSEPQVIRELLLNPRITERDVVRIASRHQAPPEVLEEVARSERWSIHYSVKKALVFNPRTPNALARGFVRHLRKKDLRLLLSGSAVDEILRRTAHDKLQRAR